MQQAATGHDLAALSCKLQTVKLIKGSQLYLWCLKHFYACFLFYI